MAAAAAIVPLISVISVFVAVVVSVVIVGESGMDFALVAGVSVVMDVDMGLSMGAVTEETSDVQVSVRTGKKRKNHDEDVSDVHPLPMWTVATRCGQNKV